MPETRRQKILIKILDYYKWVAKEFIVIMLTK